MLIRMLTKAASPKRILRQGVVYNLPREEAQELIKGDGVIRYAEPAPDASPKSVQKIPAQPDPEDIPAEALQEAESLE